jgi:hypothetical protein
MRIETGQSVIVILHSPREKLFGVLHEITAAGVYLRGVDLNYFDEWTRAIAGGEQYLAMQDYFLPMWRLERLTRDESSAGLLSLAEQFAQRTGLSISHF